MAQQSFIVFYGFSMVQQGSVGYLHTLLFSLLFPVSISIPFFSSLMFFVGFVFSKRLNNLSLFQIKLYLTEAFFLHPKGSGRFRKWHKKKKKEIRKTFCKHCKNAGFCKKAFFFSSISRSHLHMLNGAILSIQRGLVWFSRV